MRLGLGLGLAEKCKNISNGIRRITGVGNYWYWIDGSTLDEDIDIASLVYPLRYDIIIRKEFFCFYQENRATYRDNFEIFFEGAREHVYYQWFTKVLIPRFRPELKGNTAGIDHIYRVRLNKSAALFDAIERHGFNPDYPILPYTGETVLETSTGIKTGASYYMGDGCHRLAYLISTGYKTLPKSHVRIKRFRELTPSDNTSLIARHINIDWDSSGLDIK
jgi:hypothetical protein